MTQHPQTPTDRLYRQGVPVDGSELVKGITLDTALPSMLQRDVDWNQAVDSDEKTGYATASATSHYHYQNISHVLLCDKVVIPARNVPEPVQRAACLIAQQCADDATAWGTYLEKLGEGGHIPHEQREYYQLLFQETEALPVLLGIQTKNIAADNSRTVFYRQGDPIFNTIAGSTVEKNRENLDPLTDAFRDAIEPLSYESRKRLLRKIAQQVDLLEIICKKREDDIFKPLHADTIRFLKETSKELKTFYDEIGLTQNIF